MEWIELGELCEVKGGGTPLRRKKEYWTNGDIPWVKISDIKNKYVEETEEYISKAGFDNSSVKMIPKGSLIYTIFATVGKVGILNIDATTNQAIVGLEIKKGKLVKRNYLYYFLTSIEEDVKDQSRGVAQNNINIGMLKKIKIPVPPMEIQKQIVEILDEAQKLIDKRKEQIELLDDLIESIFYDMFGDSLTNDKGWEVQKLGELIEINPRKSEVSDIKDSDLEVSFVPMDNVSENGQLILEETREIVEVYRGYTYFKENDVLFAKITPCMENGKGCMAKGLVNDLGFGSTEFHVLRPKDDILTKEYIYCLTKSKKFREKAESKMTGSAGQKRVPKRFLEDYMVNVPPLPLQNQFAEKVEFIESQKELMEQSLQLMKDNYNSLMQKAFNGELF